MPDHLHALIELTSDTSLPQLMGYLKGSSARCVHARCGLRGRLWQPGFHDHALRREEDRVAIARYIVANPLRSGLVSRVGDYPHWDSAWL
jgi:REP element-mobilizing transposase RayT